MGVCNCSVFCCTLLYVHSINAIILIGKRELVALLNLSSWCLVMVERLFLAVPWGCLRFVIVVFPDHTHLLFLCSLYYCEHHLVLEAHCELLFPNEKGMPDKSYLQNKKIWAKIVSEYDQKIQQSQTADNPMAPRGTAAQPSQDTKKTN